jgi:preprotein translocase subunit SecY
LLSRLKNMFRVADLRGKVLFTIFIIAVFRLGCHVPLPYVDFGAIQQVQNQASLGGAVAFLDLFSGGALTSVAVFALGIMPYITASIIMQLLAVVIPKLEEWQNEGQIGQKKITQWTRYLTVALALMQSTGIIFSLHQGGGFLGTGQLQGIDLIPHFDAPRVLLMVTTLTAGTALIMWLGEVITQRGIGNGMSIIITVSVMSRLPAQGSRILAGGGNVFQFVLVLLMGIGLIVGIIFVESGQRKIPVQFAKRVVGRRMYGGGSTYIPMKVNQSGVIPPIFASSVLYFPAMLATVIPFHWVTDFIQNKLVRGDSMVYIAAYAVLIIFFCYFYNAIAFNPEQQADIIRKQGGFIPGIRPGPPTERYLAKTLNRLTLPGSLFLTAIAVIPLLVFAAFKVSGFPFGGTSILIIVGVVLETMKQIDSQLMMRNYEGFLR